jgi:predicted lipoprotein with Yx(FWY)xxD motif
VTVTVWSTQYGRVLSTRRGLALYSFAADGQGRSRCYGECAIRWPPLTTPGQPGARAPARGRLLGTTRRRDGSLQVTYRGHPLYRYVGDRRAGQVLCQNVAEFGGLWTVVTPAGAPVH